MSLSYVAATCSCCCNSDEDRNDVTRYRCHGHVVYGVAVEYSRGGADDYPLKKCDVRDQIDKPDTRGGLAAFAARDLKCEWE